MSLIDTAVSRDVRAYIEAGLITGCSFAFIADEQRWDIHEGRDLRVHTSIARLADVSVVPHPAYKATEVALRSKPPAVSETCQSQLARARARVSLPERTNH
ncbi:hypothetical protein AU184_04700 [Mycolicibacterium novocastrense]|nr:hypothetical protein AU072_00945 [Mycolicibacterium novocastrense]KUH74272.1 hypothetical protein AU183_12940 [Mycolicibacterium novocastrense]KUH75269.1 hypothetical protein AU184_04700 [Mycolicibacterium novocastrense]